MKFEREDIVGDDKYDPFELHENHFGLFVKINLKSDFADYLLEKSILLCKQMRKFIRSN